MAKSYHCWRCDVEVPMLTEDEWKQISPLLSSNLEAIKLYREAEGVGLEEAMTAVEDKACALYFGLTGFRETNWNAIFHHRLSLYGPECSACGYLLRTSNASYCANCGVEVSRETVD